MNDYPTCATCKYLLQINCHPWNNTIGKGRISDKLGYVCIVQVEEADDIEYKVGIFRDTDTSGCELHTVSDKLNTVS